MKTTTKPAVKRGRPRKIKPETQDSTLESQDGFSYEGDYLVIRKCPNPSWVMVRMDGEAVPVKCPPRVSHKLVGKPIKVVMIRPEVGEQFYEYMPS
jgi:hypothetical protein